MIKAKLISNCIDIGAKGKDKYTGWGIVNPEQIFLPLSDKPAPVIPKKSLWKTVKSWFGK